MEEVVNQKPILEVKIEAFMEKPSEGMEKEAYDRVLAYEHLEAVKSLGDSEAVYRAIKDLDIPEEVKVKIADVMPRSKEVISMIFYQFTYTPDEELVETILSAINDVLSKKGKSKKG